MEFAKRVRLFRNCRRLAVRDAKITRTGDAIFGGKTGNNISRASTLFLFGKFASGFTIDGEPNTGRAVAKREPTSPTTKLLGVPIETVVTTITSRTRFSTRVDYLKTIRTNHGNTYYTPSCSNNELGNDYGKCTRVPLTTFTHRFLLCT